MNLNKKTYDKRLHEYATLNLKKRSDRVTFDRKGPMGRRSIENLDGSINLKRRVITWEELTREDLKSITTFSECVKKAEEFIRGRRIGRMAIAALAIRACEIKVGGKRKENDNTLGDFAKSLRIKRSTLAEWVQIKKRVVDRLGVVESLDYTAASEALKEIRKNGGDPKTVYQRHLTTDPFKLRGFHIVSYLKRAAKALSNMGTKHMSDDQLKEAKICLETIRMVLKACEREGEQ